jgi:hypothetical protein
MLERSTPRPLLQEKKGLTEFGHVHHAVFVTGMNPDLADTSSEAGEDFPVRRLQTLLNLVKLMPCLSSRFWGK